MHPSGRQMPWWQWFLWITFGLLALLAAFVPFVMFVVAPIVIHRRATFAAKITPQQADLNSMTPETRQATQVLIEQFEAEGFEYRLAITTPSAVPNVQSIELVLVNHVGDVAVV